jgi:hypothetical protein
LQEAGDAIGHMDARALDSKLRAGRAVDLVEAVLTATALTISLDIAQ